jgi:hypothetical protein
MSLDKRGSPKPLNSSEFYGRAYFGRTLTHPSFYKMLKHEPLESFKSSINSRSEQKEVILFFRSAFMQELLKTNVNTSVCGETFQVVMKLTDSIVT